MAERVVARFPLTHLREWRLSRMMTQDELAQLAHISKATVTTLEGGKHEANIGTVGKLAQALGITRQELVYSRPEGRHGS